MSDRREDAAYHDTHLDDPDEWDAAEEVATVRPSGMTIFSLRIPNQELDALRQAAKERGTSVAELIRAAARSYLRPSSTWVGFTQSTTLSSPPLPHTQAAHLRQDFTVVPLIPRPEVPRASIVA